VGGKVPENSPIFFSWFVGGDDLTGDLHDLWLQLSPLTTSIILSSHPSLK